MGVCSKYEVAFLYYKARVTFWRRRRCGWLGVAFGIIGQSRLNIMGDWVLHLVLYPFNSNASGIAEASS